MSEKKAYAPNDPVVRPWEDILSSEVITSVEVITHILFNKLNKSIQESFKDQTLHLQFGDQVDVKDNEKKNRPRMLFYKDHWADMYNNTNDQIFKVLGINKSNFVKSVINVPKFEGIFPKTSFENAYKLIIALCQEFNQTIGYEKSSDLARFTQTVSIKYINGMLHINNRNLGSVGDKLIFLKPGPTQPAFDSKHFAIAASAPGHLRVCISESMLEVALSRTEIETLKTFQSVKKFPNHLYVRLYTEREDSFATRLAPYLVRVSHDLIDYVANGNEPTESLIKSHTRENEEESNKTHFPYEIVTL